MTGTLYVVATPIGNLEDLSTRAESTLRSVDVIACEDTRHTRKLLARFSISTATTSYHEHNEETKTEVLLEDLRAGKKVALVSDAGTPLLSDPGFRLVRGCREEGIEVLPVPGPFAAAAACSVSGLPTDELLFLGFLPARAAAQRRTLERVQTSRATLVFYLAPHRLNQTLRRLADSLGDRQAFLVREMTKLHETSYRGSLASLAVELSGERPRGEYTLVVAGSSDAEEPGFAIDVVSYVLGLVHQRGLTKKEAIRLAATELGLSKRNVYEMLVSDR